MRPLLGLGHRAVRNAREAAGRGAQSLRDRERLDPATAGSGPGELSRLTERACWQHLAEHETGRLAYVRRPGVPDLVPVNYRVAGRDVLITTGVGPKLAAAERGEVMVLEVDGVDELGHCGWSVTASGPSSCTAVTAAAPVPWANGPRRAVIRLRVTRLEGRLLA